MQDMRKIQIESGDLHDGKWDASISNTAAGENASPKISWESIDGAGEYAIYMIDEYDTDYWLHWRACGVKETELPHGAAVSKDFHSEYVGPYPPDGVHNYVIYVFALKERAHSYPGNFDAESIPVDQVIKELDLSAAGQSGNIIAWGKISGDYAADC